MITLFNLVVCFLSLLFGGYLPLLLIGGMKQDVKPMPVRVNRDRRRRL